jgi:hypothetical protein
MSFCFTSVSDGRENLRRGYLILRCKITEKFSYMQIYLQKNATLRMGYTRIYRSPGGRIFEK